MWREAARRFGEAGLDSPGLDARLLLGHVLGLDPVQLVVNENLPVDEARRGDFESLVARRLQGEPVARIFKQKEFYGLLFALNEATLVPRPETELLVDEGVKFLSTHKKARILDLGTGSGAVLIALLSVLKNARGVGSDISERALEQARANGLGLGVENRAKWVQSAWFESLKGERFDLIVSNPPYIARGDLAKLPREVRGFDPVRALDGGVDGLEAYRSIVADAGAHLNPGGALMLEIGYNQAAVVKALCLQSGFQEMIVHCDLAGHSRVIVAQN